MYHFEQIKNNSPPNGNMTLPIQHHDARLIPDSDGIFCQHGLIPNSEQKYYAQERMILQAQNPIRPNGAHQFGGKRSASPERRGGSGVFAQQIDA